MITRKDIDAAAARIASRVRTTPVLALDAGELGPAPVTLKLELLQHSGSFKVRGAFNRLLGCDRLPPAVIAASGGNHGAAVAYAAQSLGCAAEIFVPEATPPAKRARIAEYGATLIRSGASYAEAYAALRVRQAETGALDVHAYDQADVVAGQGTLAKELSAQDPGLTHVLVAVGGGGLIGGIAAWYGGGVEIVAVEPALCPSLHMALAAGQPVAAPVSGVAADSLGARQVGGIMFEVARRHVSGSVLVTDDAITAAQHQLWRQFRLVAEPGGATALAALTSGAWTPPNGARVGVVICGGNTDPGSVSERFT